MAISIGDKISKNINELAKEQIILDMFDEIYKLKISAQNVDMLQVLREYNKRGGRNAYTIGSVKMALIKIEDNIKNFIEQY